MALLQSAALFGGSAINMLLLRSKEQCCSSGAKNKETCKTVIFANAAPRENPELRSIRLHALI
jgi:hypothetical protein